MGPASARPDSSAAYPPNPTTPIRVTWAPPPGVLPATGDYAYGEYTNGANPMQTTFSDGVDVDYDVPGVVDQTQLIFHATSTSEPYGLDGRLLYIALPRRAAGRVLRPPRLRRHRTG